MSSLACLRKVRQRFSPDAELLQGPDGSLNGTSSGGTFGNGTLFVISRAAPTFSGVNQTMGNVAFTWSAVTNQSYQVQYTTNLNQAVWINLGGPITDQCGDDDHGFGGSEDAGFLSDHLAVRAD